MVIWSALLNELTQPLADVQCEASVVSADPRSVLTMNQAATIERSAASVMHAFTKRASLNTSAGSLCPSSCLA